MRRLEKFESEGRWWARTSSGNWLRWDHLRGDWVEDPRGPQSLPEEAVSHTDPPRKGLDHLTTKAQILAIALGAVAYLALVGNERRVALIAVVGCSASALMASSKLRGHTYLVFGAIILVAAGAIWYGISERDFGYTLRVSALVGVPMLLLAASRVGSKVKGPQPEQREIDDPAFAPAGLSHPLFQRRSSGLNRHLLAATFVLLFTLGALLTLSWNPQIPGFAAFVWLLTYYSARRPSPWLAIASLLGAFVGGFSIWFLSALFALGTGTPAAARSIMGASLMFLPGAWVLLSFMAAMFEDLPRLIREIPKALQRLKPPTV